MSILEKMAKEQLKELQLNPQVISFGGNLNGWLPIEEAPKDGRPVLLKFKDRVDIIDAKLTPWCGVMFVGRNRAALTGCDNGWQFAAPVGQGGISDYWLEGFKHL